MNSTKWNISMFSLLAGLIVFGTASISQASIIAQWDYNNSNYINADTNNSSGTPTQAIVSQARHVGVIGGSYEIDKLNFLGSGLSWAVSTVGYEDINVSLDFTRTDGAKNPTAWRWYYSTDGGSSWITSSQVTILGTGTSLLTLNLTDIDTIENSSNFMLKFVADESKTDTPASNWNIARVRFDNVTFNGAVVPIPAAAWMLGTGLIGLVVIRRRGR